MSNARQIAKKRSQLLYRDELDRRDQVRQAHYRKLAEEKAQEEALIAEAIEAEEEAEIEIISEIVLASETEIVVEVPIEIESEVTVISIPEPDPEPEVIPAPIKKSQRQELKRKQKQELKRKQKQSLKRKQPHKIMPSVALKESDTEPQYFTVMRKRGWYDVADQNGPVTEKALRLLAAEEMAERMNNGLDS